MLKQRIITAVVLLAILLPALFWPSPVPFAVVTLVLIAAGAWEWGRLNGWARPARWLLAVACLALCAAVLVGGPAGAAAAGRSGPSPAPLWVLAGAWLLRAGVAGWPHIPRAVRLVGRRAGAVAGLAGGGRRHGWSASTSCCRCWCWSGWRTSPRTSAGRAFGLKFTKSKLAPTISPGKSWEGVWGGMAGVLVLAVAWTVADRAWQAGVPSLYTRLADARAGGCW